jgi:23S rRNA maturation-related 3'-5' exoribonuclease YhaM
MNHELFSDILRNIKNEKIRNFTIECLKLADPILETIPTSVTGKYHPPECNGPGGLVKHIRRACHFASVLMRANNWDINEIKGDILYSAVLLHDIGKLGDYTGCGWKYKKHAQLACEIADKKKDMLPEPIFKTIRNCILHHMSSWGDTAIKKPVEKYTQLEYLTFLSDYFAAQKDIVINV